MDHFTAAFLYSKLGDVSTKRNLKARIFESVFGEHLDEKKILEYLELHGGNDIRIKGATSFDMNIIHPKVLK